MSADIFPASTGTRRFYLVLGGLILAAWGFLAIWLRSAYAELLGHESLEDNQIPLAWHLAAFLLSWSLMTVAMMLPGSLPKLIHFVPPARYGSMNNWLAGLIILAYLAPWVLFGLLVYLGDSFLHQLTEPGASLASYSDKIAPAIVLVAGLYQLTPIKRSFSGRCQASQNIFFHNSADKMNSSGILKHGLRLGMYCVGSCWSLMLLMFALGHHRLDWMLALGGIMAVERLAPWGNRLSWLVGFVLVVWAAFWVLTSGYPPV